MTRSGACIRMVYLFPVCYPEARRNRNDLAQQWMVQMEAQAGCLHLDEMPSAGSPPECGVLFGGPGRRKQPPRG